MADTQSDGHGYVYEEIDCIICGSGAKYRVADRGQFGLPTHVVLCKSCGLGYLSPRWNRESYLHFYQEEYDKYYRPFINKQNENKFSDNVILNRLDNLHMAPERAKNILDIGSGDGENLFAFGDRFPGSNLFAIEPSKESQAHLRSRSVKLISADVDSDWEKTNPEAFDLIIMRHVLEHFMNPLIVLRKIRRVLKQGGMAYIAVPNNLNPTSPLTSYWFRVVHTFYFNKYSLNNLMALAGLSVVTMVEGDDFNRGEVYLIVQVAESKKQPTISKAHYKLQKELFTKKLRAEKKPPLLSIRNAKNQVGRVLNQLRS